jgi:predicted cobalt transporter CbtA
VLVNTGAYTPLTWFFYALSIAAFVVEAWALIDAVRRPSGAFTAADKQTKQLWLIILGVATAIGLFGVTYGISLVSILPVAAFIAAGIYLTDVRPKVSEFKKGSSNSGPYGPW